MWTIDFKGQFRPRDGVYCYPLTSVDHYSRYVLCCQSFPDVKADGVQRQLRRLFHAHGLPEAIRSDNGAPFASNGIHGLNGLNAWWLQLGIVHQRITPASPQENGAHERMHRELKARVTKPAAAKANLEQRVFNTFVHTYNHVRPHEALQDETPASRWCGPREAFRRASHRPSIRAISKCVARVARAPFVYTMANNFSVKRSMTK